MASADLKDEVTCCICTEIYKEPVTLNCGHSFCQLCITRTWDNQEEREYSCPECRHKFWVKPELKRSPEHVLTEPTTLLENSKCSVHQKILEYYCLDDAAYICMYCSLAGEHRGHQVETLNEVTEKKKETLRNILDKLTSEIEETKKRVESLQELKRQLLGKAAGVKDRVTALIRDIRDQLEALENRQLEIKKEELHDIKVHDIEDLDVGLISVTLYSGLAGIVSRITRQHHVLDTSNILLDVNTGPDMSLDVNTGCNISVSRDLKTVSWSKTKQIQSETPGRFQDYHQVLNSRKFSSGQHYWEVEVSESGVWEVGMAYPTIERRAEQSGIGYTTKSWILGRGLFNNQYYVKYDSKLIRLRPLPSCWRFGIFLDYEARRLSFYELCDPIRHVHTFTASFPEPLHAVFRVIENNS
uniref:Uncharacterized protein n=1 Tax=Leptobrachium leishanense TaxID=445787 RepID=A0A8C5MYL3_9ANUR